MRTVTKKELIDHIALSTGEKRVVVKKVVQSFLDSIIVELGKGMNDPIPVFDSSVVQGVRAADSTGGAFIRRRNAGATTATVVIINGSQGAFGKSWELFAGALIPSRNSLGNP